MNTLFTEKPPLPKAKRGRPKVSLQKTEGRSISEPAKKRKAKIPTAVQEAIWIQKMGRVFEGKCLTTWCPNIITVFDFHAGHNIPESKGGTIDPENLFPICARCNLSMGDRYTLIEWSALSPDCVVVVVPKKRSWWCFS